MDLSILIVSYNTRELTLACIESVYRETREVSFEVIVVDNGSSDDSADAIADGFPHVRLLRTENLGFARANNLAALEARGRRLLLLNPDTVILDGAIDRAVAFANGREEGCIVGGCTLFPDGTLNPSSCHGRPTPWSLFCMGLGLSSVFRGSRWFDPESLGGWKRDSVKAVDAVSGCFLLILRTLWDRLRGFDESFFMYGEDLDLCLRASEHGATCRVCPDARLIHYGGASEPARADKMVRLFKAKAQLFRKHWRLAWVPFGLFMLSLWSFSRMAAWRLIATVRPHRRDSCETWAEVWRRRSEITEPSASVLPVRPSPGSSAALKAENLPKKLLESCPNSR